MKIATADFETRCHNIAVRMMAIKRDALVLALDLEVYGAEIEHEVPASEERDQFLAALATLRASVVKLAAVPDPKGDSCSHRR